MTTSHSPLVDTLPLENVRARRGGMIGWGVVFIVIGTIAAIVILTVLFDWLTRIEQSLVQPHTMARQPGTQRPWSLQWSDLLGAVLVLAAAVGSVWTGIGCCIARRWTRPIVLIGTGFVMVVGVFVIIALLLTLRGLIQQIEVAQQHNSGSAPSAYMVMVVFAIQVAVVAAVTIVIPGLAFRFFLDARTAEELARSDPKPAWTDRCPVPVLAWSAACLLVALSLLMRLFEPSLPAFVTVLSGAPAIVGLAAVGVLLAWGGWRCYRLDRLAWVVTFILLAGLRVSSAVYLWTGGDLLNLSPAEASATALTHVQQITMPGDWMMQTLATMEAGAVMAFGLFVAPYFSGGYRFGIVRSGDV